MARNFITRKNRGKIIRGARGSRPVKVSSRVGPSQVHGGGTHVDVPAFGLGCAAIGDSITADRVTPGAEEQGWGAYIGAHLNLTFYNYAVSGTSSKSFYETYWDDVKAATPRFVLFQFGHNDSADDARFTDPNTTYSEYMKAYVDETRAWGGTPILVTSSERTYNANCLSTRGLAAYVNAAKAMAKVNNVGVADLHERSIELYESSCFADLDDYMAGEQHITHTNDAGAAIFAGYVVDEIRDNNLALRYHLKDPVG